MDEDAPPADERRAGTHDPIRARHRALAIVFQADIRGVSAVSVLDEAHGNADAVAVLDDHDDDCPPGPASLDGFTRRLVEGLTSELATVDDVLERFARNWTVSRMPAPDRSILRLAAWELLRESTPAAVVIDEAIRAARAFSTEDSPRWVNGVLEAIRADLASAEPGADDGDRAGSRGEQGDGPASDAVEGG